MSDPIILYDIPGNNPNFKAWSPNTWNTRYVLNFKGLPYKTEWVEYPDIETVAKKIGATTTDTKADGSPLYTLPIIYDPSTKQLISDSLAIARYLENTYPNTPRIFPPGTQALIAAFGAALGSYLSPHIYTLVVFATWKYLNEPSQIYFRRTREADFGKKLEDFVPEGEIGEAKWRAAKEALEKVGSWLDANGEGSEFVTGDQISYADILIAARLRWAKTVLGPDSKEWAIIAGWNEGRWDKFLKRFEEHEAIV